MGRPFEKSSVRKYVSFAKLIAKQPSPGRVHGFNGGAYAEHTVLLLDSAFESSSGQRITVFPVGHAMVTLTFFMALTNQIEFS